ncbi:hypothetical protein WFZ85_15515 [Flavobacterium sp. j3]|uniref:DUF4468 domain-containing protein n=1 Tax=Flavobacterium aureirubrum TaxID=3133147 RepID=A0ABU9NAT8_9FLAO
MKKIVILFVLTIIFSRCNIGAGTLGSFDDRRFPIKKSDFVTAVDSLTEKQIPDKWKETATGIEHTYEFMKENTCLYLKDNPEEMYFVSYNGSQKASVISVRSVFKGGRWYTKNDFDKSEIERIEKRFDEEIIEQIERKTRTKAERIN